MTWTRQGSQVWERRIGVFRLAVTTRGYSITNEHQLAGDWDADEIEDSVWGGVVSIDEAKSRGEAAMRELLTRYLGQLGTAASE